MNGKLYLGKCDGYHNKRKTCKVFITWKLEEKEKGLCFSASVEVWNNIESDIIRGGQCVDKVAAMFKGNKKAQRIAAIWEEYHLNDMKGGLPEQEKAIKEGWAQLVAEVKSMPDGKKYFYDDACLDPNPHYLPQVKGFNSYYDWKCDYLKQKGLYELPLPTGAKCTGDFPEEVKSGKRGYRYGERWIYLDIPADVVAEIKSW
jgi:hypothetical protein